MIIFLLCISCDKKDYQNAGITHFAYQETENGNWGIISIDGEIITPPIFQGIPTPVTDDMFFVLRKNNTYELHNINNPDKIIEANFTGITNFSNGRAFVRKKDECISCIDKKGNVLYHLPENIQNVSAIFDGLSWAADNNNKFGYINMFGENIIPFIYDATFPFVNGYGIVIKDNDIFVIDKDGSKLTNINSDEESFYNVMMNYSIWQAGIYNNIVPFMSKNYFGLKNVQGKIILPADPKYKIITRSWGGYCIYRTENGYGIMTDSGKILINDKYTMIASCNANNNQMFTANIDGKWGILSMEENVLCPFTYDLILAIVNSNLFVGIKDNTYCLLTKTGEKIKDFHNINMNPITSL